jgi:hypothetical protein
VIPRRHRIAEFPGEKPVECRAGRAGASGSTGGRVQRFRIIISSKNLPYPDSQFFLFLSMNPADIGCLGRYKLTRRIDWVLFRLADPFLVL